MPAYPDSKEKKPESVSEPAKSNDPKTICAGATEVKMSLVAPNGSENSSHRMVLEDDPITFGEGGRTSSVKAKSKTYSMADLEALEKKAAWEELLSHAEDIAPAQRTQTWEKLVEKAAVGYMQQLTTETAAFEGIFTSQALLGRYPNLQKSQDFMTKRGEAGKLAAERCLRDAYRGKHCVEMMKDFLKAPNTSADIGFAFGKIARKNQNHDVAVSFFKWALDKKKDAAMCTDEDLQLAVIAGLGLPSDYEDADGARRIAANACWESLKPGIQKELLANPTGYYRDNACAVLKAKGAL